MRFSNHRIPRRRRGQPRLLKTELLESRVLLDSGGISAFLSLSFVPDGTAISHYESQLFDTFDRLAATEEWQSEIEQAFNSWAMHTNADIAHVPDNGDPLGTTGRREGDDRFGDVRVAAAPLADTVMAISFPSDNVALGTWSSDIIFNSRIAWQSLDQLASVAVHEAGHIFGLSHSDEPSSAMHFHGASNVTRPSANDILNLQYLFGTRSVDPHEGSDESENDALEMATQLSANLGSEVRTLSYGDIAHAGDVDVFRIGTDDEIEGAVFVRVDTSGLSLLAADVQLLDDEGSLLATASSVDGVAELNYLIDDEVNELLVRVEASESSPSRVGRYSIAVTLTEEDFDDEHFDDFSSGDLFTLGNVEQDARSILEAYVVSEGDEYLFEIEDDPDVDRGLIVPKSMNAGRVWYDEFGSIAGGGDTDLFRLRSPDVEDESRSVMTVNVRSLTAGGLIPDVAILDERGRSLDSQLIVSGNGELVLQTDDLASEEIYQISVRAAYPEGVFARGNYQLTVNFGSDLVQLESFSQGTLSPAEPFQGRLLHVAEPQLFHFLFSATAATSSNATFATMHIFDEAGNVVHGLASDGNTRSGANVLLEPGTYTVQVGSSIATDLNAPIPYQLWGLAIANPLGVVPVDPTAEPAFACDGTSDRFCYPGGTSSASPFFWEDFIRDFVERKSATAPNDAATSWWDWYLQGPSGTPTSSEQPTTTSDTFRVVGDTLIVGVAQGVLFNDVSHSTAPLVAAIHTLPSHGTLNFATDGSFRYTPDFEFFGVDTFSYQAFDFNTPSAPTSVTIHVSRPGDANDDGHVNFADFLLLAEHFGSSAATWNVADFDGDGMVTFQDFLVLSEHFGAKPS